MSQDSGQLEADILKLIRTVLHCKNDEIADIEVLKKGMTNRSFLFRVKKDSGRSGRYIMRIPGEGTGQLVSRTAEAAVYQAVRGKNLCEDPVYLNSHTGYKITKYIENVRCCDAQNMNDLRLCMKKLKKFHRLKLAVPHVFDLFERIDFYESLWGGNPSIYRDYQRTKENVQKLRKYIESCRLPYQLSHIDAVADNFLFDPSKEGEELHVQLTDWEYAGMQDPHVDLAMFCIYSLYSRQEADRLIDIYFEEDGGCPHETRIKIYCYIAVSGLLWSNWCEYKRKLGAEFGEYSKRQYQYAKDFYRYVLREIN